MNWSVDCKLLAFSVAEVFAATTAMAVVCPPYDVYPYMADSGDDPPVNYMKVCEPGVRGEQNASYVVIGIGWPYVQSRLAIDSSYDGDIAIPAYIDGLPVSKINESAFLSCTKLRRVTIPPTVREIGDCAFRWCTSLTNIVVSEGVTAIGEAAFSNCVSLTSIRLPATLSHIGRNAFARCDSLTDVHFNGNAPRLAAAQGGQAPYLGEKTYDAASPHMRPKLHAYSDTSGWIAPYVKGVPEKWPVDMGYVQAYEMVEEARQPASDDGGFVAVVTEIKGEAVAVPKSWAEEFADYKKLYGNDFASSLLKPTGKTGGDGKPLHVWQDYVAGTDPTDSESRFTASIKVDGDAVEISFNPNRPDREYTIYGRQSLYSGDWEIVPAGDENAYNFFKVTVELKLN